MKITKTLSLGLLCFAVSIAPGAVTAEEGGEGCPLSMMTGKAKTNEDWWPNQLNLDILHQNSLTKRVVCCGR